jgi:hypothetical protein
MTLRIAFASLVLGLSPIAFAQETREVPSWK